VEASLVLHSQRMTGDDPAPEQIQAALAELAAAHPESVECQVPLRELTTFRIGGPALGLVRVHTPDEAHRFQALAREHCLPLVALGGGSNILADDRGFCGLVLRLELETFTVRGRTVIAGAGLAFDDLVVRSLESGLVGLEFASGIPGTVGGAVVGNAGCYGHEISEFLREVVVLRPDGRIEAVTPASLQLGYRSSALKCSGDLVLEATLDLRPGDTEAAWQVRRDNIALRRKKHPWREPSAGSYFRNLPPSAPGGRRQAAGELLEKAGVKGMRVGGAAVYEQHANIIINTGNATCADVLTLAARMKAAVRDRFGVELQEEVRHLPWHPTGSPNQPPFLT
jgi:UDP-N-acetylmuramate dehydrogenase